jgi:DNA repair protein SbcC/Rad50
MRLHALSLTAFGPFPGTEHVDFDDLNEAGLFLLAGPTGAGKTSILDAVCFALFGSVPGARGVKALKSQHAEPQTRPEVELDFSIAGRRFVVRRSPEWARPKRRGSGLLTEKATATLVETTSGADHLLSSRAQEVGHQICELVGMTAGQFAQVAMLPQGEFQRFLRATTQERHDVLQHLFKTDRFARIEDWVADHSRTLRERSSAGEAVVRRILDTAADRAGLELPAELTDLTAPGVHGQVLPFLDQTVRSARDQLSALGATHDGQVRRVAEARAAHREAERLAALHVRLERSRQVLATLESEQEADEAARATLDNDRRATRCESVLRLLDDASAQHEQLSRRCTDATAELREVGPMLETPTADALI